MKKVILRCPKCSKNTIFNNWFIWVLHSPFHWFRKRYTKCAACGKKMGCGEFS